MGYLDVEVFQKIAYFEREALSATDCTIPIVSATCLDDGLSIVSKSLLLLSALRR